VVETAAPAGYVLDPTPHGIHVDAYNPALENAPVLTVTNKARPALRILKYDQQSKSPMLGVTFEVYHDGKLLGEYTTNENGEIFLYELDPGTYYSKSDPRRRQSGVRGPGHGYLAVHTGDLGSGHGRIGWRRGPS